MTVHTVRLCWFQFGLFKLFGLTVFTMSDLNAQARQKPTYEIRQTINVNDWTNHTFEYSTIVLFRCMSSEWSHHWLPYFRTQLLRVLQESRSRPRVFDSSEYINRERNIKSEWRRNHMKKNRHQHLMYAASSRRSLIGRLASVCRHDRFHPEQKLIY